MTLIWILIELVTDFDRDIRIRIYADPKHCQYYRYTTHIPYWFFFRPLF